MHSQFEKMEKEREKKEGLVNQLT